MLANSKSIGRPGAPDAARRADTTRLGSPMGQHDGRNPMGLRDGRNPMDTTWQGSATEQPDGAAQPDGHNAEGQRDSHHPMDPTRQHNATGGA